MVRVRDSRPIVKPLNYLAAGLAGALCAGVAVWRHFDGRVEVVERVREVRVTVPAAAETSATEDAARLKSEAADLRARLETAETALAANGVALSRTREQLAELRRPMELDLYSSALKADLKSGEVVVTGGYRLPDGKRLYAFARPVVDRAGGEPVVRIGGRFVALGDEAGKAAGLDNLATNANNTLQHGEVWVPEEQDEVLSRVTGLPGVDVVAMKDIAVPSGGSGVIAVGNIRVSASPVVTDDADGLSMELRLEQSPPVPRAP